MLDMCVSTTEVNAVVLEALNVAGGVVLFDFYIVIAPGKVSSLQAICKVP